jgi:hypothetical protein
MQEMAFIPWMTYKLIFSTILSIKIIEFCIFRYVQLDWVNAKQKNDLGQPVINPIPKISVFKEMYGAVTGNIAMNAILGSVFGSVVTQADRSVVLLPTTVEGIPVTGLVFGLITGVLVTNGVVKSMKMSILASGSAMLATSVRDKRFSWMPVRKGGLMCLISLSVMIFSTVALPSIMTLFGKSVFDFFQFSVFITIYATLISKPLSYVLIRRCMQPDFIRFTLRKSKIE